MSTSGGYHAVMLPQSEFSVKLMACLQYFKIPYTWSLMPRNKKLLPGPGLIPVLKTPDGKIIYDTMEIFNWLNENEERCKGKIYPKNLDRSMVEEIEVTCEIVYCHSQFIFSRKEYFDKCQYEKWDDFLKTQNCLIRCLLSARKVQQKFEKAIPAMIKDKIGYDSIDFENPTKGFQKTMEIFESILKKNKGQYLLGNTDGPTAPDFALYGMLVKLLPPGFMGFMPTLYENISILADPNNGNPYRLLQKWHENMASISNFNNDSWADVSLTVTPERPNIKFITEPFGTPESTIIQFDPKKHGKRVLKHIDHDTVISKFGVSDF